MYVMLEEFAKRRGLTADDVAAELRSSFQKEIRDAQVTIFGAPPIDGLGTTGGFKLIVDLEQRVLSLAQSLAGIQVVTKRGGKDVSACGRRRSPG